MKVLVLALDYDDCLVRKGHPEGEHDVPLDIIDDDSFSSIVNNRLIPRHLNQWKHRLLNTNRALIGYIESIAAGYDKIIVCCTSNRQDLHIDTTNSCRGKVYTGSCYEGLELFTGQLEDSLKRKIFLDKTLVVDFFANVNEGHTFEEVTSRLKNAEKESHPEAVTCPSDRTKIILHRMFMHKFANEYPGSDINYVAVDDNYQGFIHAENPAIIDALRQIYTQHPELLPHQTKLTTVPYKGKIDHSLILSIEGTGLLDTNYGKNLVDTIVQATDKKTMQRLKELESCDAWSYFSSPSNVKTLLNSERALRASAKPMVNSAAAASSVASVSLFKTVAREPAGPALSRENPNTALVLALITTLTKEIQSCWPYPNKDRKQKKVDGLNELLKYIDKMDAVELVNFIVAKHPGIQEGKCSTRTADLLEMILAGSSPTP